MSAPATVTVPESRVAQIYPRKKAAEIYRKPPRLTLRLRAEGWREHCAANGITSDVLLSAAMGLTATTIWRVRAGEAAPSAQFIAATLRALPGARFEELFESVPGGQQ